MLILKLSLDLPENISYVTLTRRLGRTALQYFQVSPVDIGDVETILDELCSNVIRHAHSVQGRFRLHLHYHADRVIIIVRDRGKGFTFADIPPPGTPRPDFQGQERLGGFGLKIVGALSDQLQFYRTDGHGTTIRAEKRLTYQTQAASDAAERRDEEEGGASLQTA